MSERNEAAPHECPACGEPAYLGFGTPAKCVQKGCLFYDAKLWAEWVVLLPDVPDPVDFDDDTDPYGIIPKHTFTSTFGTRKGRPLAVGGTLLDTYGATIGKPRKAGESDDDYYERLLDWGD